jgi:hypothetical protein
VQILPSSVQLLAPLMYKLHRFSVQVFPTSKMFAGESRLIPLSLLSVQVFPLMVLFEEDSWHEMPISLPVQLFPVRWLRGDNRRRIPQPFSFPEQLL